MTSGAGFEGVNMDMPQGEAAPVQIGDFGPTQISEAAAAPLIEAALPVTDTMLSIMRQRAAAISPNGVPVVQDAAYTQSIAQYFN